MFSGVGGSEVLVILLLVLILFGARRVNEFARTLGRLTRGLRKTLDQVRQEIEASDSVEPKQSSADRPG